MDNYQQRELAVNSSGGSWQSRESDNYRESRDNEDNNLREHMIEEPGFVQYLKDNFNFSTVGFSDKSMQELWDMYISDMEDDNEG